MKKTMSYTSKGNTYTVTRGPDVSGTWLQGYVGASYTDLVLAFGQPTHLGNGGKTQAEWDLKINGTAVTIYDYKEYDKTLDRIFEWHIGGTSKEVVKLVEGVLAAIRK